MSVDTDGLEIVLNRQRKGIRPPFHLHELGAVGRMNDIDRDTVDHDAFHVGEALDTELPEIERTVSIQIRHVTHRILHAVGVAHMTRGNVGARTPLIIMTIASTRSTTLQFFQSA
jgi:hypothetical protein